MDGKKQESKVKKVPLLREPLGADNKTNKNESHEKPSQLHTNTLNNSSLIQVQLREAPPVERLLEVQVRRRIGDLLEQVCIFRVRAVDDIRLISAEATREGCHACALLAHVVQVGDQSVLLL
jgi:hypothetical protein